MAKVQEMRGSLGMLIFMLCAGALGAQTGSGPAAKPQGKTQGKPKPKHLLRYAIHPGRTGAFDVWTEGKTNLSGAPSLQAQLRRCGWEILGVKAGWAEVEFRFRKVQTAKERNPNDGLKEPLRFFMNARGQLRMTKTDEVMQLNDMAMVRLMVRELPAEPVAVGDRWESQMTSKIGDSDAQIQVRNTVRSFQKGRVRLDFSLGMEHKNGMMSVSSEGSQGFLDYRLGDFLPTTLSQQLRMTIKMGKKELGTMETVIRIGPVGTLGGSGAEKGRPSGKTPDKPGGKKQAAPPGEAAKTGKKLSTSGGF